MWYIYTAMSNAEIVVYRILIISTNFTKRYLFQNSLEKTVKYFYLWTMFTNTLFQIYKVCKKISVYLSYLGLKVFLYTTSWGHNDNMKQQKDLWLQQCECAKCLLVLYGILLFSTCLKPTTNSYQWHLYKCNMFNQYCKITSNMRKI